MKKLLSKVLNEFKTKRVLVIGDVMLDKYVYGRLRGISPEAQVPKFVVEDFKYRPGGAANVAMNLEKLGCYCFLTGVIGDDVNGDRINALLENHNIRTRFLTAGFHYTTVKTRLINLGIGDYMRIDHDIEKPVQEECIEAIVKYITQMPVEAFVPDAIVISDYFKGVFRHEIKTVINAMKEKHPEMKVILDPKGPNCPLYQGLQFDVMTPNLKEAFALYNVNKVKIADCLYGLYSRFQKPIIITKGKEGYHGFDGTCYFTGNAIEENPVSVVGAGDTFNAGLTMGLACGLSLEESAEIGNLMASIAVRKPETSCVWGDELLEVMGDKLFEFAEKMDGCYTEEKKEEV